MKGCRACQHMLVADIGAGQKEAVMPQKSPA